MLAQRNIVDYLVTRHVRRGTGGQVALSYGNSHVSYDELDQAVTAVSGYLLDRYAIQPRDRVLVSLPNSIDLVVLMFASMAIGAAVVPVNPGQDRERSMKLAKLALPRIVIGSPRDSPSVRDLLKEGPWHAMSLSPWRDGLTLQMPRSGSRLGASAHRHERSIRPDSEDLQDPGGREALWLQTSGSRGAPKVCIHTHDTMALAAGSTGIELLGLREHDRSAALGSFAFTFSLLMGVAAPLAAGATAVVYSSGIPGMLRAARQGGPAPTIIAGVPYAYQTLLQSGHGARDLLRDCRVALSAGEPLPGQVHSAVEDSFGLRVTESYGASETFGLVLCDDLMHPTPGCLGVPVPGTVVELHHAVDGFDESQRLLIKSPSLAVRYLEPAGSSPVARDGWWDSRDLAVRDDTGRFWFRGRVDRLFKTRGMWKNPEDIESRLMACPEVLDALVRPEQDANGMATSVLYMVFREHASPGAAPARIREIFRAAISRGLESGQLPDIVYLMRKLPRTVSGKRSPRSVDSADAYHCYRV